LPEGEVERKESPRAGNNSPFWWYSDDDNNGEFDEASNTFVTKMKGKKVHSMDEIKHTRYLRMKSPEHWLSKMGKVPLSLLSSSIVIGHTKLPHKSMSTDTDKEDAVGEVFEEEQNGFEEKQVFATKDAVNRSENSETQESGLGNNDSVHSNSELQENCIDL